MNARDEAAVSMRLGRAERRYRLFLRLLPPGFRREAERDLVVLFRSAYLRRCLPGSRIAIARFWARMMLDLLVTTTAEMTRSLTPRSERLSAPDAIERSAPARPLPPGSGGPRRPRGSGDGPTRPPAWFIGSGLGLTGLRGALRRLLRDPRRAVLPSVTLGLGIGAALIMLVLVQDVLLRPLPFREPERLVRLLEIDDEGRTWWPSYLNFADWRAHAGVFDGVVAVEPARLRPVIHGERAERVPVAAVSRGFLQVLGVSPARGREMSAAENVAGGAATAMVSWSFWTDQLGGGPLEDVFVTVGSERFRIVGVTPPGFRFLGDGGAWVEADVWLPLDRVEDHGGRRSHGFHVVGRVAGGIDLGEARRRMDVVAARLAEAAGEPTHAASVRLTPLQDVVVGSARQPLTMLSWGALLVLVVASFNLAGTLFAAGIGRADELALRRALGARRSDLLLQLLADAAMLAVPGALLGVALAGLGLRLIRRAPPEAVPRLADVSLDGGAVALAIAVAAGAALIGGLAPAGMLSSPSSVAAGTSAGRGTSAGPVGSFAWRAFVAVQVALTLILLTAGGLLLRSVGAAGRVDLGYDARPVLALSVSLPESRYAEPGRRVAFFDRAIEELSALPGVTAVGVTNVLPHVTQQLIGGVARPDNPDDWMFAGFRTVNEGYFEALSIPRIAWADGIAPLAGGYVVVDESIAEVLFGGADPVGETLASSQLEDPPRIGGLVGAVREWNHPLHALGTIYLDYRDYPELLLDAHLLVRVSSAPGATATAARAAIGRIDPVVPVEATPLRTRVRETLAERRLVLAVAAAFGLVTLALAAVGVYSVVAFATRRRRREAGIRLALGARPGQVSRTMSSFGLRPALAGLLLGAAGAVPAGRLLQSQLFGIAPHDPVALVGALAVLAVIAGLAAYIPGRAASRQDVMVSLRQQ